MKPLAAVVATVIGVAAWGRRIIDRRRVHNVIAEAERIVRVEQSRLNHPSNRGR